MDFITSLRSLNSLDDSKLRNNQEPSTASRSFKDSRNLKPRNEEYDSILVMVDRLTKYTHFIPYIKSITAEELAHLVLDRLIRYHGIPKSFITDRDKLFTSNY